MLEPENKLFYRLEPGTALGREQQRLKALSELGLIEAQTIPIFEEATQTTAYLLDSPICILGFLDQNRFWFKSAVGLSQLGLMNQLAQERQLPRNESFCAQVVESHQVLAISDTLTNPAFTKKLLVQHYGIRAYLGAPLFTADGNCLGAIAVMDLKPRTFTIREIKFLELIARWSMSEFERNRLLKAQDTNKEAVEPLERPSRILSEVRITPAISPPDPLSTIQVKLELLGQLTQELRTPLTSVLGMAGVVSREIYGPLTAKQKEYLEIIQNSGRYLLSLVNEISELGALDESIQSLNLISVDIEMLCQQAINILEEAAHRQEQEIRLSVEPGRSRTWVLDKDKVRQLLYHLIFSVIQTASTGSIIHIHVSHKDNELNLAVSVSHPWLGDGLTQVDPYFYQLLMSSDANQSETAPDNTPDHGSELPALPVPPAQLSGLNSSLSSGTLASLVASSELAQANGFNRSHESLRLLLSCYLAELHGGHISIQGTPESGYRYVVSLPELKTEEESP
jgi:signal transduction histidine kinase